MFHQGKTLILGGTFQLSNTFIQSQLFTIVSHYQIFTPINTAFRKNLQIAVKMYIYMGKLKQMLQTVMS